MAMPVQRSLFDAIPGFVEPPAQPGKRRALLNPEDLPAPEKFGPPRIRFGTSSWTYTGWSGKVYRDVAAYGSEARFTERCLAEYARDPRFRTAGADNLYYAAPAHRTSMLARFRQQLEGIPGGFDLCPKVWHGITVNRYTQIQRDKWRLGTDLNRYFLDPEIFVDQVVLPLQEGLGPCLGPLILELQENAIEPATFAGLLDRFLGGANARASCNVCVELRTLDHFTDRYLDVLSAHGAGHVLNSWTRMPPIGWQHQRLLAHGYPGKAVLIRALLRPGRLVENVGGTHLVPGSKYDEAVEAYQPYDRLHVRLDDVRADILRVIKDVPDLPIYTVVNNRLEGHSPETIAELEGSLWGFPSDGLRGTGDAP